MFKNRQKDDKGGLREINIDALIDLPRKIDRVEGENAGFPTLSDAELAWRAVVCCLLVVSRWKFRGMLRNRRRAGNSVEVWE